MKSQNLNLNFQASFFTEIREIVRPEDLPRFDCLIYQRGNLLDKLLRGASASASRAKVSGSYDEDDQVRIVCKLLNCLVPLNCNEEVEVFIDYFMNEWIGYFMT